MITHEIYQQLHSSDEEVRLQTIVNLSPPSTSKDIETLVKILADQSWRVRKAVVQLLSRAEINSVVPFLIKALSVGNIGLQNVRFHNSAIECLSIIGQPAIPDLTKALHDEDKNVRIAAANVLGAIRHHDACDVLIHALKDEHVNVRYAAVEALSRIPSQQSVIPLTEVLEHDEDWLKLPAISALGHIGDYRATPYLIKMAEDPLYLQTVVEALGNIGDERGIPCIINALGSTDKEIRKSAVLSMESMARKLDKLHTIIQQPSTYQPLFRSACTEQIMLNLIELADDKDFNLVVAAMKLLGWSGRQDAAYALLEKLGNEQYLEVVASSLIQIGEDAVMPLANAYKTARSLDNKLLIIDCLREIGGEKAFQLMLQYLEQTTEEFIIYALLKSLTKDTFVARILEDRSSSSQSTYFIRVLHHIKHHLGSPHPLIRAEAIYLWGQLLGEDVLDDLLNATKDIDPTIRIKAIEHLGHFVNNTPELLEHLILLLSDDHPNIRKQVACALGHAEHPAAFPALLLVLEDSNPSVQRAAVNGIGIYLEHHPQTDYRQQVLEKLADVLENRCRRYEDGLLKIEICHALTQIDSEQSQELLLKLTRDVDFDVRKSAILALGAFQASAKSLIPIVLPFLQDPHWSVREAAVTALGALHAETVEAQLLPLLDDPDIAVRKALLLTLGRIGSPAVIPILIESIAHDELDYAAYQGLSLIVKRYKEQIMAYQNDQNPKVHLYVQHILKQNDHGQS